MPDPITAATRAAENEVARVVMQALAHAYHLEDGEEPEYVAYTKLFNKARNLEKDIKDLIHDLIAVRIGAVRDLSVTVAPGRADFDGFIDIDSGDAVPQHDQVEGLSRFERSALNGFRHVRRRNVRGSYVVFSDHHIFDNASRQDFFSARNKALYLDILRNHYGQEGWHLVENGDLEELLIFEPDLDELQEDGGTKRWDWDKIWEYRGEKTRAQLERIVDDNRDYYDVLWQSFAARGRYHKLVGNHDVALLDTALMDVIRARTGHDFDDPDEVLLLSSNSRHRYFICHGHQFDHSCTPGLAKFFGETFSQAGGWAFEGPDRNWKWTDADGNDIDFLQAMLEGERPVYNEMVGIEPSNLTALQVAGLVAAIAAVLGASSFPVAFTNAVGLAAVEAALGIVPAEQLFEGLTGKSIAMEYFENPRIPAAVFTQIAEGLRWFKFRHMDELALAEMLRDASVWGETPVPTLVIGHSHEPRLRARHVEGSGAPLIDSYINSGAAGRFENLIWAVEIVNGVSTMVSWHYPDADPSADPVRTIWTPEDVDGRRQLVPARPDEPEEAEAGTAAAITTILGMMMPA